MPVDRRSGLEAPGVAARPVVLAVAGFLALAALTGAGLAFFFRSVLSGTTPPSPSAFPAPRLQTDPRVELGRTEAEARARLGSYGWVDREAGLIRIPIDRAMERIVARGAAGFDPVDGPAVTPSPVRPRPGGAGAAP